MKVSEKCLTAVLEDLERATSLARKSYIIEDIDPNAIEAFVSPDMWLWSWPDRNHPQITFSEITKEALLIFSDQIILEALERFADCECEARKIPLPIQITSEQAAPHKITDIRVRRR